MWCWLQANSVFNWPLLIFLPMHMTKIKTPVFSVPCVPVVPLTSSRYNCNVLLFVMFAELIDGADVLVWKSVRRLFNNPAQAMTLSNGIITLQQPQFPITLFPVFVSERASVCVCLCDWERECSVCVCVCGLHERPITDIWFSAITPVFTYITSSADCITLPAWLLSNKPGKH